MKGRKTMTNFRKKAIALAAVACVAVTSAASCSKKQASSTNNGTSAGSDSLIDDQRFLTNIGKTEGATDFRILFREGAKVVRGLLKLNLSRLLSHYSCHSTHQHQRNKYCFFHFFLLRSYLKTDANVSHFFDIRIFCSLFFVYFNNSFGLFFSPMMFMLEKNHYLCI